MVIPKAKPVAQVVLFAFQFLISGIGSEVGCLSGEPEDRFYPSIIIGSILGLLLLRPFRNIFLRTLSGDQLEDRNTNFDVEN